jgi:SAM-dependent methyltransferase
MEVLQTNEQIREARERLVERNLSALPGPFEQSVKRLVSRTRLHRPLIMGDYVKSWDVLATVRLLEEKLAKDDPILDFGCYASEILIALYKAGFTNLSGVDLDPRISRMPHADRIRYRVGDFMNTPFEDASFQAITSISVIEHGFNGPRLFAEVSRLLRPGGYFIASFDYWQKKIDTTGTRFFDMDWLIFSEQDVQQLLCQAAEHGLHPIGDLNFEGRDKAVKHGGYEYTFAWLALQKRD